MDNYLTVDYWTCFFHHHHLDIAVVLLFAIEEDGNERKQQDEQDVVRGSVEVRNWLSLFCLIGTVIFNMKSRSRHHDHEERENDYKEKEKQKWVKIWARETDRQAHRDRRKRGMRLCVQQEEEQASNSTISADQ